MTTTYLKSTRRGAGLLWAVALAAVAAGPLTGCASDQQKINAINAVNEGFRIEYEKLLAQKGTRHYAQPRAEAFLAMRVTLAGLGMVTEQQDLTLGHLAVAAPAPLPLSDAEWARASQADLPLLQRLIEPHVGLVANFVKFEPQGLDVVINATVLPSADGCDVSLTVRLREVAPPRSGWPRRQYVAPHLLELGLEKIFAAYERELRAAPRP